MADKTFNKIENRLLDFNQTIKNKGWQVEVELETKTPILKKGLELLSKNGDLLLAICLNNGYYSRENIYRMLQFSLQFSNRVQIFFTDGPAKHNYRAKGTPENEIIRECRLHRNRLSNHCIHGLEKINSSRTPEQQYQVTFLDWQNIYTDVAYNSSYGYLKQLYSENTSFQSDINNATRRVLENRMGQPTEIEEKVPIAIEYVLEELAFILSYSKLSPVTKPVADHGVNGFNYIYYEPWPVFENLVNGHYDSNLKNGVGFTLVKVN